MLASFRNQAIQFSSTVEPKRSSHEAQRVKFLRDNLRGCIEPPTFYTESPSPKKSGKKKESQNRDMDLEAAIVGLELDMQHISSEPTTPQSTSPFPRSPGSPTSRSRSKWWTSSFHPDSARSLPMPALSPRPMISTPPQSARNVNRCRKRRGRRRKQQFWEQQVPTDFDEGVGVLVARIDEHVAQMKVEADKKLKAVLERPEIPQSRPQPRQRLSPSKMTFAQKSKVFQESKYFCPDPTEQVPPSSSYHNASGDIGLSISDKRVQNDSVLLSCETMLQHLAQREREMLSVKASVELDRIREPLPRWFEMRGKEFHGEFARANQKRPSTRYSRYLASLIDS